MDRQIEITFRYASDDWSEEAFQAAGGFVAVVLNYNKKGLIAKAALSALNQDYPCYEVLMMDDCSRDGSEEEMLAVAREFAREGRRGRKITVVFNRTNRTILGQWETAVSLSSGTWFGMFCGDDESRPYRLSTIRRLSLAYPESWVLSTNIATNESPVFCPANGIFVWRGSDIKRPRDNVYGCSCFWRREVLSELPEKCNLDDYLLYWCVIIRRFGDPTPAIVWDTDVSTVQYGIGTGITTELMNDSRAARNWWIKKWYECVGWQKVSRRFGSNIWHIIEVYNAQHGHSRICTEQILGFKRRNQIVEKGWFGRIGLLCLVFGPELFRSYGGYGREVHKTVLRDFIRLFLGPASFCAYAFYVRSRTAIISRILRCFRARSA